MQLLGSDASRSLPCLASQEARVDVDAWPAWHRLHTGVVVLAGTLDPKVGAAAYRLLFVHCMHASAYGCIASSQAPKRRTVQSVRPLKRQEDT